VYLDQKMMRFFFSFLVFLTGEALMNSPEETVDDKKVLKEEDNTMVLRRKSLAAIKRK